MATDRLSALLPDSIFQIWSRILHSKQMYLYPAQTLRAERQKEVPGGVVVALLCDGHLLLHFEQECGVRQILDGLSAAALHL